MHESAIAKSILEIVSQRLHSIGAPATAHNVSVVFGEFRNAEPESVEFAFDNMKAFYPGAANCQLVINTISAMAQCKRAQHKYHPEASNAYRCPTCDSGIGNLLQGEELDVVNVVVELDQTE
ncbi:MAG TPA: hydrogenase maturation nickel metallochaperone HypA [Candidatus Melainabacteria bacterium]|jgi:hydrogenase nickel incorporation protein HypA/HybF|nr:hydrogenase maturation nickel metallochaperone HypA [Candidatus Melainabacteria bacterium]HIN63164.1 hydrogenase maturation nickel metallochaperone HypA [Candidatus Obscuribacterales bacterium]